MVLGVECGGDSCMCIKCVGVWSVVILVVSVDCGGGRVCRAS